VFQFSIQTVREKPPENDVYLVRSYFWLVDRALAEASCPLTYHFHSMASIFVHRCKQVLILRKSIIVISSRWLD